MFFLTQGHLEVPNEVPKVKLKQEKMDPVAAEPHVPPPAPLPSSPAGEPASPPPSGPPFTPVAIKQEPQSPVRVWSEPDPVDHVTPCAHSTTPELRGAPAAASSPGNGTRNIYAYFFTDCSTYNQYAGKRQ